MLPIKLLKIGIQRKGKYNGSPSLYVGVGGCNLRCVLDGKSCNREDCVIKEENPEYSEEDVLEKLEECKGWIKHVVFSGGEPLLYKKEMEGLVERITTAFEDIRVTIETNGTLPPLNPLKGYKSNIYYIISPKKKEWIAKGGWKILPGDKPEDEVIVGTLEEKKMKKECFNVRNIMNIIISCGDYSLCFPFMGKNIGEWVREVEKRLEECAGDMGLFIHEFYINNHSNDHIILTSTMMKDEKYVVVDEVMSGEEYCKIVCTVEGWKYGEEFEETGDVEDVKKLKELVSC